MADLVELAVGLLRRVAGPERAALWNEQVMYKREAVTRLSLTTRAPSKWVAIDMDLGTAWFPHRNDDGSWGWVAWEGPSPPGSGSDPSASPDG